MKSREQKLADMEAVLAGVRILGAAIEEDEGGAYQVYVSPADLAERLLDAAEREEPKWPTKESFTAALKVFSNFDEPVTPLALQSALAAALLMDPIVRAAADLVREYAKLFPTRPERAYSGYGDAPVLALFAAVRDAGLLSGTEGK